MSTVSLSYQQRPVEPSLFRALALAACLLAACAEPGPRPLVFAVGGAPAELAVWEEITRDFSRQHGVPVELLRQPSDTGQRRQALVVALAAGQADPDVFLMDVAWLGLFAASGWLAPLDGQVDETVFFEDIVARADTHRGRLVALPVYVDGGVLYARKDLLAAFGIPRPPGTWEELRAQAAFVQQRMRSVQPDFFGFVWQGAQYEGLICNFLEFAGSRGGFVEEAGRLRLDTPANRAAVSFMRGLVREPGVSPPSTYTEMKEEETRAFFESGKALFERNRPYAWPLHQRAGSAVRGKTLICPLPRAAAGGAVSTLGGWHIGVSRFSDAKAAALAFVRHVTGRGAQAQLALRLGWNPGRKDLYEDAGIVAKAPHLPVLAEVFRSARPRPAVPYYNQVSGVAQRAINAVLAGKRDTAPALSGAQAEIDVLVERYGPRPSRQESAAAVRHSRAGGLDR